MAFRTEAMEIGNEIMGTSRSRTLTAVLRLSVFRMALLRPAPLRPALLRPALLRIAVFLLAGLVAPHGISVGADAPDGARPSGKAVEIPAPRTPAPRERAATQPPPGTQPAGTEAADTEAAGNQPAGNQPAGNQAAGNQAERKQAERKQGSRRVAPGEASRVAPGGVAGTEGTGMDRWSSLPPGKRREIQALYEKLRALAPQERAALLDRLRSLEAAERRQVLQRARDRMAEGPIERRAAEIRREILRDRIGKLPEAERERLRSLSPEERGRYLAEQAPDARKRMLSTLPVEVRERALALPPQEQARFLRQYRSNQVFRDTFRDPKEVRRLRALTQRELTRLLRPAPPRADAERPAILSEETWLRWRSLQPYEQTRVLSLLVGAGPRPAASSQKPLSSREASSAPARDPAASRKDRREKPVPRPSASQK